MKHAPGAPPGSYAYAVESLETSGALEFLQSLGGTRVFAHAGGTRVIAHFGVTRDLACKDQKHTVLVNTRA